MALKKYKQEEDRGNPFQNLDKTTVLQETRIFNETPVSPRKCNHVLIKILYLIYQGEQFGKMEATDAFFAMTKLFQSKDIRLRRMVYLAIKELSQVAEDVIIVTSSLTRDMTGKDLYRAAAIRALRSITDAAMLQTIERYMKQALVDKNPSVSSGAIVSSLHMTKSAGDVVKRWVNEIQEGLNSENDMVQYQAIGLMYHIQKSDRLAVIKLVSNFCRTSMKLTFTQPPFTVYHLLRIICKLLSEETDEGTYGSLLEFVDWCLTVHKSEIVRYEAACVYINLRRSDKELTKAINALRKLPWNSTKPQLRFAAVRTLNKLAMTRPNAITTCNVNTECFTTDSNRSVAALAVSILLRTVAEPSVDELMIRIPLFVKKMADEFKIIVSEAIRDLCEKYPRKHKVLMKFLSNMLQGEGGMPYRFAIADILITIMEDSPEAKDTGLEHLCDFVEISGYNNMAFKILHLLGREGPKCQQPSKYIRFIYDCIMLEFADVRVAAISTLGRFGAYYPELLPHILVLLKRCQVDTDDEVRDRATYHYCILAKGLHDLSQKFILEPPQISIPNLERDLQQYIESPCSEKFDMNKVLAAPIVTNKSSTVTAGPRPEALFSGKTLMSKEDRVLSALSEVPKLVSISGSCVKGSGPHPLTELETEYVVNVYKYTFSNHIILRFEVTNTLNDQLLENVRVHFDIPNGFELLHEINIDKLSYNEIKSCWFLMQYPDDLLLSVGTSIAILQFVVKDCDPISGLPDSNEGYADDYMLEDLELSLNDQMIPVPKINFLTEWDEVENTFTQLQETYMLTSISTIEEAVTNIVGFMGMCPCERSEKVQSFKSSHTLYLSGKFRDGTEVLIQAKLAMKDGVSMQLTIRTENSRVPALISSTIE